MEPAARRDQAHRGLEARIVSRRARQIDAQQRRPGRRQPRGRRPLAGAPAAVEVQQLRPRLRGARERQQPRLPLARRGGGGLGRHDLGKRRQPLVEPVVAEQEVDRLPVEREPARQQRLPRLALMDPDQPVPHQRRLGREAPPRRELRARRAGEQVEREVDARPAPRRVVLEVGVDALVAAVELRRQGHRHEPEVDLVEPEGVPQPAEPRLRPHRPRQPRREPLARDPPERAGPRRRRHQPLDLALADVGAEHRVRLAAGPLHRAQRGQQQRVEAREQLRQLALRRRTTLRRIAAEPEPRAPTPLPRGRPCPRDSAPAAGEIVPAAP